MPIPSQRRAFTLLEILLVLAILVVIAAVSTPAIARFARTQELRSSGDVIRGEWARARVKAMKSGRVHVFVYESEGNKYSVDYWVADDDLLEAGDDAALQKPDGFTTSNTDPADSQNIDPMFAEELPSGIRFVLGESVETSRSAAVEADLEANKDSDKEVTWSTPILFYSDGTTSTAEIVLANKEGRAVRVSLRGLTGVAQVSEVFNMPEAEVAAP